MNKKQSKKFLVIFLPIIALVVAIISIVGGVVASNKANPVLEVIGKEGVTTGESSEEEVVEEKTYTISGCTFSGTGTHLVVKSGTNYIVEDCTFSGKEGETSTGSAIKVEGGTLTLNNSTVENIETTVDGTGINVATSGTLTLNSSTIRNCKTIGSGGAIYSEGSVIIKGDSLISNNSAGTGGAIWSLNSLSILGNTNIVENGNSNSVGGGIYSSGVIKLGSDDEAWTGKISDNIASIGHGIYSWKQIETINIEDGALIENLNMSGSQYIHTKGELTIKNLSFSAVLDKTNIFVIGGKLTLSDTTIDGITTTTDGGAIKVDPNAELTLNNVNISNCSANNGGAVFNYGTLNIIGGSFTGNSAADFGGAFYSDGVLNIESSTISNCSAGSGGAIRVMSNTTSLKTVTIQDCSTTNFGGAIRNDATLNINGGILDGDTIQSGTKTNASSGGAIWNNGTLNINEEEKVTIKNFKAAHGAGIYNTGNGIVNITTGVNVQNCIASTSGGFIQNVNTATIKNSTIENCSASVDGGAIYSENINGSITLMSNTIRDCSARHGGAIFNTLSSLEISDQVITNCSASNVGGSIYNTGNTNITSLSINNCSSDSNAGGIYSSGTVSALDLHLSNCIALNSGGSIFNDGTFHYGSGTIDGGNTSEQSIVNAVRGGGVYNNGTFNMNGVLAPTLKNLQASIGGGIYNTHGTINIITGINVQNCVATDKGGGIYNDSKLNIDNCNITNCSSIDGGGIHNNLYTTTVMVMNDGIISDCTANNGAGVYGKLTMNGGTISGCTAANNGAGVYGVLEMNDGSITDCVASSYGGGLYTHNSDSFISGGSINDCSATLGGGVYSQFTFTVNDGEIVDCSDALYLEKAVVNKMIDISGGDPSFIKNYLLTLESKAVLSEIYSNNLWNFEVIEIDNNTNVSSLENLSLDNKQIYIQSSKAFSLENIVFDVNTDRTPIVKSGTGELRINACTIENSTHRAITLINGSLTIDGDTLIQNCSHEEEGGAIYSSSSYTITFFSGQITRCSAPLGGAVCLRSGKLSVDGGTITYCTATENGGGIYVVGVGGRASLTDSNITNCTAKNGGGIFVVDSGSLTLNSGTIEECTALETGGAVFVGSRIVTYEGMNITNCSAEHGGAFSIRTIYDVSLNNINIDNCRANGYGGSIYLNSGEINIDGGMIHGRSNNLMAECGGAIWNNGIININGQNKPTINTVQANYGAGIYNAKDGIINIETGIVATYCEANNDGGFIYNQHTLVLKNSWIEECGAVHGGAVMSNKEFSDSDCISEIIDNTFRSNYASEGGGAIALYKGAIATINSVFENSANINAKFGGGIYVAEESEAVVTGGSFSSLRASSAGGAITNLGNLDISGSEGEVIFDSCSAEMGGAIANSVYNSGSGLSVTLTAATATINNAVFTGNSATEGESNAIVNIGHMQLGGITQSTNDQDICIGRLSVLFGSITATGSLGDDGVGGQTIYISFAKASLSDITDFSTIQLDTSATKSSFTYDVDGISFTEYSA